MDLAKHCFRSSSAHHRFTIRLVSGNLVHSFVSICLVASSSACHKNEADREHEEQQKAVPERVSADGDVSLSDEERKALGLEVEAAVKGDLPNTQVRFGLVQLPPGSGAVVTAPFAATIASVPIATLGEEVSQDAPLVEVTPALGASERLNAKVQSADLVGQIEAAKKEYATKLAALRRDEELAKSNIVSRAKLLESETAASSIKARLGALEKAHTIQAGGKGGSVFLKAPIAGRIISLEATEGAVIQPGTTVAVIERPGPRWIDLPLVPNAEVGEVYEVQPADTAAAWLPAKLLVRGRLIDADGFRHDRLLVSSAGPSLLAGSSVTVRVASGAQSGTLVPESAAVPTPDGDLAFVEAAPGVYAPRPVEIAARFAGKVRLSGVEPGEKVVVQGAVALRGEQLRSKLQAND